MKTETAKKIGQIMQTAADDYRSQQDIQFAYDSFADCVGAAFWAAFPRYEQSTLMQWVYTDLCEMGFTPLESHQNY